MARRECLTTQIYTMNWKLIVPIVVVVVEALVKMLDNEKKND